MSGTNEELLSQQGNVSEGFIPPLPLGAGAGLATPAAQSPGASSPVVISGASLGQLGWIDVNYEWFNPTAFNALAAAKYTFAEGVVPNGYRFVLRRILATIQFDTDSVSTNEVMPFWPAMAHSSNDAQLVIAANGAPVAQGLNVLDSASVGASYQYTPTVFDIFGGADLYRVFDENIQLSIYAYVTWAANNAFMTNSVGVKTNLFGVLIPKA